MTRVTYTGPARAFRQSAHDIAVGNGETIDVSPDVADQLVADYEFERAGEPEPASQPDPAPDPDPEPEPGPEFDVLTESVDELEAQLEAGDHDDQLVALKREEEHHDDRKTAKEAIDERRRAVADTADANADTEGDD